MNVSSVGKPGSVSLISSWGRKHFILLDSPQQTAREIIKAASSRSRVNKTETAAGIYLVGAVNQRLLLLLSSRQT